MTNLNGRNSPPSDDASIDEIELAEVGGLMPPLSPETPTKESVEVCKRTDGSPDSVDSTETQVPRYINLSGVRIHPYDSEDIRDNHPVSLEAKTKPPLDENHSSSQVLRIAKNVLSLMGYYRSERTVKKQKSNDELPARSILGMLRNADFFTCLFLFLRAPYELYQLVEESGSSHDLNYVNMVQNTLFFQETLMHLVGLYLTHRSQFGSAKKYLSTKDTHFNQLEYRLNVAFNNTFPGLNDMDLTQMLIQKMPLTDDVTIEATKARLEAQLVPVFTLPLPGYMPFPVWKEDFFMLTMFAAGIATLLLSTNLTNNQTALLFALSVKCFFYTLSIYATVAEIITLNMENHDLTLPYLMGNLGAPGVMWEMDKKALSLISTDVEDVSDTFASFFHTGLSKATQTVLGKLQEKKAQVFEDLKYKIGYISVVLERRLMDCETYSVFKGHLNQNQAIPVEDLVSLLGEFTYLPMQHDLAIVDGLHFNQLMQKVEEYIDLNEKIAILDRDTKKSVIQR